MIGQNQDRTDLDRLATEARMGLSALVDPTYEIQRVIKSESPIIGVRVPRLRSYAADFLAGHPEIDLSLAVGLLDRFADARVREEMLLGIFLIAKFRRGLSPAFWARIDAWIDHIDNWEVCDQLVSCVAGPILGKNTSLVDDLVDWSGSPSLWRRRFAVVCGAVLNQQGRSNPEATLRICAQLMADPEPMVQKAVGWALREASERDAESVLAFMLEHKNTAQRRILREGSEKLSLAQRALLLD